MSITNSIRHLINQCLSDKVENVLIICDQSTLEIASLFGRELENTEKNVLIDQTNIGMCHGQEPEKKISDDMLQADTIICLTQYSLAHTNARRCATKIGIPFLSMPGYSMKLLQDDAIMADYKSTMGQVVHYSKMMSDAHVIHITTNMGTDLVMSIDGRNGNACPGLTNDEFLLGSPPDIEANIAPIEEETTGVLIIDASVTDPRIGLLNKPLKLRIEKGHVVCISTDDDYVSNIINDIFGGFDDNKKCIVGEFGIGFNNLATLCGNMLTDEGTKGCVHFGLGSNWTIGGKNKIDFHLDFVMKNATVELDDTVVIKDGVLLYE